MKIFSNRHMKNICSHCDYVFTQPNVENETHNLENPPYENIHTCPNCGSDDFSEAQKCAICGIYTKINNIECDMCLECRKNTEDVFNDVISRHFNETQKTYITEAIEEGRLL